MKGDFDNLHYGSSEKAHEVYYDLRKAGYADVSSFTSPRMNCATLASTLVMEVARELRKPLVIDLGTAEDWGVEDNGEDAAALTDQGKDS